MASASWKTYGLPKCKPKEYSEQVLVTWIPNWNKKMKFVSTAIYIPYHWCTTDDIGWDSNCFTELEYCEERDDWWIPNGWYETTINTINDIGYIRIDGEVIAWDKIPKPYKAKLKNMENL